MPFELTASDDAAIAKMKTHLSSFETEQGRIAGLSYTPSSPSEVIITTSPKAGTTWMQQICHQLRFPNDMSFDEISEVVPWFELAQDQGQDINAPQPPDNKLRIFKTHAWYPHCPKPAKYVVVVRQPADVALSFYKFFEGWFFEPGTVTVEAFVREFWLARGEPDSIMQNASFYHHFLSWWERRDDPDVLFLFFEDLKDDLAAQVQRVAAHVSTEELDVTGNVAAAVSNSTFDFMKANEEKFNESLSKRARNVPCGLHPDAGMQGSKINKGEAGSAKHKLSDGLKKDIDARWTDFMLPATGFASYDDLRASYNKER
jgi:hypothetical protein